MRRAARFAFRYRAISLDRDRFGRSVCGKAEVFIGLLEGDHMSYLKQDPDWTPNLGQDQDFRMADLLRFAGVA